MISLVIGKVQMLPCDDVCRLFDNGVPSKTTITPSSVLLELFVPLASFLDTCSSENQSSKQIDRFVLEWIHVPTRSLYQP
mmetsp:Transcript_41107/g.99077  ORF Transcript_41107/g.99077 Transcript_41107/m.99077 type:complete len:80 (-) Transcript_41107:521-760(-)